MPQKGDSGKGAEEMGWGVQVLVNLTNHNPVGWSQFYEADGVGTVLAVLEASRSARC